VWRFRFKLTTTSASSLGMMSDEEKRVQRIEDIKELLS
jgi:DNA repair protein RAD5